MLLLIDAGNTRVKWAHVADNAPCGQWTSSGSVAHDHLEELEAAWRSLDVKRVLVSNVAGATMRGRIESMLLVAHPNSLVEWFTSSASCGGLRNGYRQPQQLGCDRFASAIGARALFPDQALLVATCGTATTVDAISADGVFTGGMILPGLKLMAESLARNTAQLPQVIAQGENLPLFADNTDEAIISGCISAQVGAIERAYAGLTRKQLDEQTGEQVRCVVAGGAGTLLAKHLAIPCIHVDNLVLPGLQTVAHYSSPLSLC